MMSPFFKLVSLSESCPTCKDLYLP